MKPIILRELKDRKYTILAYSGIVLLLLVMYIALFPTIKASMDQFQQLYESYPKEIYEAMGVKDLSLNTLANFLSIEMYNMLWQLLALLLACSLAGYTIAGQIDKGTIGYYLSLPISRTKLFFSKYISGLAGILAFVIVSVGSSIPLAALFNDTMPKMGVLNLGILALLFALATYSFAMFLSAVFSEKGKVYMIMGGLLVGMYAMNVVAGLKQSLAWLDNYSIFHYFNAQAVLSGNNLQLSSVLVYGSVIVIFTTLAVFKFNRRDISV
jgi:ABC-2 type transport system permease protein